ncbi:OmpA family protein [Flavobacterium sp.]|uniref:OmpA family protein n=1 Tax=Flavobacterium sp. TaxID=239 RepID=UPI003BD98AAE
MNNKYTLAIDPQQMKISIKKEQLTILFVTLLLLSCFNTLRAQDKRYTKPSWFFGVAGASNFNFYRGSTQMLNADFTPPSAFHNGEGAGLYLAPNIEFHRPNSRWGFIFQAGFDSRRGKFNVITEPCNCPTILTSKLSYITIEPSLRVAPFKNGFYVYGGPRLAFNQDKSFNFEQKTNPAYPLQVQNPDVKGDFSDIKNTIISMQIGIGYDVPLNAIDSKTQFVLSPFLSYHPYFGQNPRTTETWNVNTLRAGIVLKFGQGHLEKMIVDGVVQFSINPPINVKYVKNVREVFPIRNYIFFNKDSNSIPERYVQLERNQVKDFKEDKVQFTTPQNMSGRSMRQMQVYYNILNILGDRMVKNPTSSITLEGSSENGAPEGKIMAQNVKDYLVTIFDINDDRIAVEGSEKPAIPSGVKNGVRDLDLLREGNRRVTIESESPELLMEFQSGKDAPLKPVEIISQNEIPNGDVFFNVGNAKEALTLWTLQTKAENGKTQTFGPYSDEQVAISRKSIMGDQPEGNYTVVMSGTSKSGKNITQESVMHLAPYVAPEVQESVRFSIIYEYNESKSIAIYDKYLTEIVTPKIPFNATVIITGHTDSIGEESYNIDLSLARAKDVKAILEKSLDALGRKDVKFLVTGEGEDEKLAPFENKFPEERFYNRTVVIDIAK